MVLFCLFALVLGGGRLHLGTATVISTEAPDTTAKQPPVISRADVKPGMNGLGIILRGLTIKDLAIHHHETNRFLKSCRDFVADQLLVDKTAIVLAQLRAFSDKATLLTFVVTGGSSGNDLPKRYDSFDSLISRWAYVWTRQHVQKQAPKFGHQDIIFEELKTEVTAVQIDSSPPSASPYWAGTGKVPRTKPKIQMWLKLNDVDGKNLYDVVTKDYLVYSDYLDKLQTLVSSLFKISPADIRILSVGSGSLLLGFSVYPVPKTQSLGHFQKTWYRLVEDADPRISGVFPSFDKTYPALIDSVTNQPVVGEDVKLEDPEESDDSSKSGDLDSSANDSIDGGRSQKLSTGVIIAIVIVCVVVVVVLLVLSVFYITVKQRRMKAIIGKDLADEVSITTTDSPLPLKHLSEVTRSPKKMRSDDLSSDALKDVAVVGERTPLAAVYERS